MSARAGVAGSKPRHPDAHLPRQPGANIIITVDHIIAPLLSLAAGARIHVPGYPHQRCWIRTTTIRASVRDVEITMSISISLVNSR